MKTKHPEPAKVSYFFGKGYTDLWNTIKESWSRNIKSAGERFSVARENGYLTLLGGINIIATISIFSYGSLITTLTTVLHFAVLIVFFSLIYIGFSILWIVDRVYILVNKIKNACPNPDCQAQFIVPVYECPGCGAKHERLAPSKYGILRRTCSCGMKLPTTFLNGRGRLNAYCPECNKPMLGDTASRQYAFPVIGGPSVGKTCFIHMAIDQIINDVAPAHKWKISFISRDERKEHERAMRSLENGRILDKTDLMALTAFQLMLKLPNEKIGRRIYVYDISGEMFARSYNVQRNPAYSYAEGFIFIIDPLTLHDFADELRNNMGINIDSYRASANDFDDILDIMLNNLEQMLNLRNQDILPTKLAVVINKADIPTLEEKIGETAAQRYLVNNPRTCKNYDAARNEVCCRFLYDYGAGNFVRKAERRFSEVMYFSCSALGHNYEGQPYEGKHVVDPVMWLLRKNDSSITSD